MISNILCSFIHFCALHAELGTESSNSEIGCSSFRWDLVLLNWFDNSLAYSLIKEIHAGKTSVSWWCIVKV